MAPLPGSLMWACNNLRQVGNNCQEIKIELEKNKLTHTSDLDVRKVVERPTFVADITAMQLHNPGIAGLLENIKQMTHDAPSEVYSSQSLQLLLPKLSQLTYQEVAFYQMSSTAKESERTVIKECDPIQPFQGINLYLVLFIIEQYTRQDESALRTKVKCSKIDPSRAISIYLQTILHTPAFLARFRYRSARLSFGRLSLT